MAAFKSGLQKLIGFLIAGILMLAVILFVVVGGIVGAGTVLAGIEYPFGKGPWGKVGSYCRSIPHFVADYETYNSSGSKSSRDAMSNDLKALYHNAPDPKVKSDWKNWIIGQSSRNQSLVTSSAKGLNAWEATTCNTWDISLPIRMNNFWNGFLGPQFGPLINVHL